MRSRIGRPNIPLLVISTLLALTIWITVQAQNMQIKTRDMTVPLIYDYLNPRFVVTKMPTSVPITIEGPGDKMDDPALRRAQAVVDLRNATAGVHTYNAIIEAPDADVKRLLPRDTSKVSITIEQKVTKTFNVQVESKGRLTDHTLSYAGAKVEPETVQISGAERSVNSITKVRVMFDLDAVDPNSTDRTFELRVEALDDRGLEITDLNAVPASVTVQPTLQPATVNKDLFVIPNVVGRPATGYEVVGYKAIPEKVSVTGASLRLAQSSSVPTEPINIEGLSKSVVLSTKLQMPPELTLLQPGPVMVRFEIRRQQTISNASPPAVKPNPSHGDPPFPDHVGPLSPPSGGSH